MALLLTYGVALLAAVLVSERAERTVLSTAVLFLAVGIAFGTIHGPPDRAALLLVADRSDVLVRAIAATIAPSIVAHSSSDVPVARWLRRVDARQRGADVPA